MPADCSIASTSWKVQFCRSLKHIFFVRQRLNPKGEFKFSNPPEYLSRAGHNLCALKQSRIHMTEAIDQMQTMLCKRILLKWINALGKASGGPLLVFGIHVSALHLFNTYYFFPNFDIPMHFLGGLTTAFFLDRALMSASLLRIVEPCHVVIAESLCSAARASWQYLGSILKFSSTCLIGFRNQPDWKIAWRIRFLVRRA
jgi:hypothetical protein